MAPRPVPRDAGTRSRLKSVRHSGTAPEIALQQAAQSAGLTFEVNAPIPGTRARPDVLFREQRLAVFVDGCFWHGCPEHGTDPINNSGWWREKLATNKRRDDRIAQQLRDADWDVVRLWEHQAPADSLAEILRRLTTSRVDTGALSEEEV